MDLPASVAALGEQLGGTGEIAPDPALFREPDVFAAERERIFARPWMAVDHATRLDEDGHYFRCDAATRSVIVTRESGGQLHALRNVCIHAGYPVCDAEEGPAERLICPYHGWEYALDGNLLEPAFASRVDRSRLRLARYRVCVRDGVIFVDPSSGPEFDSHIAGPLPSWLPDGRVARRARYSTTWNWKFMLHFLGCQPHLFFDDPTEPGDHDTDTCFEFGPLSRMMVRSERTVLLNVIPRFAERTDLQLIEIVAGDAASAAKDDAVADGLRRAGEPSADALDHDFFGWYWSLMSPA